MYEHLLLYDGQCGLCDAVVAAVLKRDTHKHFCFAPLQGETAARFLQELNLKDRSPDSVVLIENFRSSQPQVSLRSKAVWKVCWHLGGVWKVFGIFKFLPGWLFDWGYMFVARARYRLFGKRECRLPQKGEEGRFLP